MNDTNYLYKEHILNYIADFERHLTLDRPAVCNYIETQIKGSSLRQRLVRQCMAYDKIQTLMEGPWPKLKHNQKDNRVWNLFVALPSELRQFFSWNGLKRKAVIDLRAAHPTYWAKYIKDTASNSKVVCSGSSPTGLISSISLYVGTGADAEYNKWNKLWTDPNNDPRLLLMKELDYKTIDNVKEIINQTLNGASYKKVHEWLNREFPILYKIWLTTDVKETGPNISKEYETKLFLNEELYRYCEGMGIKLSYEYDGVSVFTKDDAPYIEFANMIARFIQSKSEALFGIRPVIKTTIIN